MDQRPTFGRPRGNDFSEGSPGEAPLRADAGAHRAIPAQIGPYRVVRQLGAGGFGVVYEARSSSQPPRVVAVKVLLAPDPPPRLVASFRREIEVLRELHHPYIVGYLDDGQTDEGMLYCVMEYVDGVRITEYCDQNKLTIVERLELFERVCEAVGHAHNHGIGHRELKLCNILVFNSPSGYIVNGT